MAKIFEKLGLTKPLVKAEPIDVDKDLSAIITFFKEINGEIKNLHELYKQFEELRRFELKLRVAKAPKNALKNAVQDEIMKYDEILKAYEFFELDVDVSGERVKKIGTALKEAAQEVQVDKKFLTKMEKDEKWTFDW